jgi:tetratricopeptide (TPR) repeat protein
MRIAIYTLVLSLSFGIALIPGRLMANNNAYQEGQYAQALDYFSAQLSLPNVEKGPLYYNIGNAYYKQGDYAKAYWAYQKARRYLPRDADLYHNLILTETQLGFSPVKDTGIVLWVKQFPFFNAIEYQTCLWISLTTFSILFWIALRFRVYKRTLMFSAMMLFLFATGTGYRYYQSHIQASGIVIGTKSPLKAGPITTLPTLTTLPAGTPCRHGRKENGWIEIRVNSTLGGWISERDYWAL